MVQTKNNFVSGLKFISMNINSIRGKKLELLAFLDFHQPHVVAIQETKIATSELFPEMCPYSIYRKDRNLHGGGVTLLVHKDIQHMPIYSTGKQLGSQFGSRCFQTKLLIMWQVGVGHLIALVKTSSCSEISLAISGANIKVTNSPRFML